MAWLPHGEKNFEDIFIRFGATHERYRQTDRQTDGQTPHADNSRAMHSIARHAMKERIEYKLLSLTYKILTTSQAT